MGIFAGQQEGAGWCGLTVVGHMCKIPFSLYTLVGGTERKGNFVVCLIYF